MGINKSLGFNVIMWWSHDSFIRPGSEILSIDLGDTHFISFATDVSVSHIRSVEPLNKDTLGDKSFVPCREVVPISEVK